MKLTSMELSKKEKKDTGGTMAVPSSPSGPDYPYGLTIELEDKALEKLGIKKLPATGGTVTIEAKATVRSTSIRAEDGKERRGMTLQITDLSIEDDESYEGGFDNAADSKGG